MKFDETCNAIVRAAYQISGLTGARVSYEQLNAVVPLTREDLGQVVLALQARELTSQKANDQFMDLTAKGLSYAAQLPPVSEPPMFQDI
jgi:hypothetical protein